jgi:hypothetical protein
MARSCPARETRRTHGFELGLQIAHAAARQQLGDGLTTGGDHFGLAGLHLIQQAGALGLGLRHRHLRNGG